MPTTRVQEMQKAMLDERKDELGKEKYQELKQRWHEPESEQDQKKNWKKRDNSYNTCDVWYASCKKEVLLWSPKCMKILVTYNYEKEIGDWVLGEKFSMSVEGLLLPMNPWMQ